jgi:acyl carrier protein
LDNKLPSLLADVLHIPVEKVTDDLAMSEVESWDSLQHMSLIATLEQTFGIDFTFEEIITMQSMQEIKRVLREKGVEV